MGSGGRCYRGRRLVGVCCGVGVAAPLHHLIAVAHGASAATRRPFPFRSRSSAHDHGAGPWAPPCLLKPARTGRGPTTRHARPWWFSALLCPLRRLCHCLRRMTAVRCRQRGGDRLPSQVGRQLLRGVALLVQRTVPVGSSAGKTVRACKTMRGAVRAGKRKAHNGCDGQRRAPVHMSPRRAVRNEAQGHGPSGRQLLHSPGGKRRRERERNGQHNNRDRK